MSEKAVRAIIAAVRGAKKAKDGGPGSGPHKGGGSGASFGLSSAKAGLVPSSLSKKEKSDWASYKGSPEHKAAMEKTAQADKTHMERLRAQLAEMNKSK
jgi:hypothetical protein